MKTEHVQNVITSLAVLSLLISAGMIIIMQLKDIALTARTVALPFAFIFIFVMSLVIGGQISEQPTMVRRYLLQWLFSCIMIIFLCVVVFIIGW